MILVKINEFPGIVCHNWTDKNEENDVVAGDIDCCRGTFQTNPCIFRTKSM
jgi:hypothetical protein